MSARFMDLRGGDRVVIVDRFGKERIGKVSPLLVFEHHVVLDMGGRHGTPAVADATNVVRVTRRKARA